jgi:hypothetical protein
MCTIHSIHEKETRNPRRFDPSKEVPIWKTYIAGITLKWILDKRLGDMTMYDAA